MREDLPLFPEQVSTIAPQVDALFFAALGISAFFSLLIATLIFYLAVRYRRTKHNLVGKPEKTSLPLELTWTAIPLVIALGLFYWGAKVYFVAARAPANATEYFVVGKQWMWKIQHLEGNREINELHVPVDRPIKLTMTSEDVIHSFFVPAFRIKMDVLPGRYTTLWFQATKTGSFALYCAEYCGAEHSLMKGRVVVMEPADYEAWLAGSRESATPMALSGKALFGLHACNTCHRPDSAARAPHLEGIAGRSVTLKGGKTIIATDNYLRESILNPAAKVVDGYEPIMPSYQGQIGEEELQQLVLYLRSIAGDETEPGSGSEPGGGAPSPTESEEKTR